MRPRAARLLAAAAIIALPVAAGCGALERTPVTVPTVTAPAVTGPQMSTAEFRSRAEAACTRLYSRLGRLGKPPTGDIGEARRYHPAVADAWHRLLGEVGSLKAPADVRGAWGEIVEAYRATVQNADENVLLAKTDREAIEVVNSDASARMQEAQAFMAARAQGIGLPACAGG